MELVAAKKKQAEFEAANRKWEAEESHTRKQAENEAADRRRQAEGGGGG